MKKCILSLLLILLLFQAHAQGVKPGISLYGGPSLFSFIADEECYFLDYVFSYKAAGGYSFKIGNLLAIGTRIQYENSKINHYSGGDTKSTRIFTFVGAPVVLQYYVGSNLRYFLSSGFTANYLTSLLEEFYPSSGEYKEVTDLTDRWRRFNYGFSVGFGYKFPATDRIEISFELQNTFGLRPLNSPKPYNTSVYPNCLSLLIGVDYKSK